MKKIIYLYILFTCITGTNEIRFVAQKMKCQLAQKQSTAQKGTCQGRPCKGCIASQGR